MKQTKDIIIVLVLCLTFLAPHAIAAEHKLIDTTQLKAMIDSREEFTLVDARTKEEYDEAHIIKAINITEKGYETQASQLPSEKNALLVIYCNGVKCGKSKKVAAKAAAAGYTNITIYTGGRSYTAYRKLMKLAYPNIFQTMHADWKEAGQQVEK